MKTILVPTDFSVAADNAVNYAAEFGMAMKAGIILFHAFHLPTIITSDVYVMTPDADEPAHNYLDDLNNIKSKLQIRYGTGLTIDCVSKYGLAVDEINKYVQDHKKIDCIVMGMQGAGYITEKLMGSVTTALIRKSECPVFTIDKKVKFRHIRKVVLACDYIEGDNKKRFSPIIQLARVFGSHIYILNIDHPSEKKTPAVSSDIIRIENILSGVDHTFHALQSKDVVAGINEFVIKGEMDLVVMIPHKHNLLETIFRERNTKKMAFHSMVPLLTLKQDE